MANSDVKLKHKVQLRKKVEEPEVSVNNGDIDSAPTPAPEGPKSKLWLWILLPGSRVRICEKTVPCVGVFEI